MKQTAAALLIILLVCLPAVCEEIQPGVNNAETVDGHVYMGIVPVDAAGLPNPSGPFSAPALLLLAQQGNRIWGSMVLPLIDAEDEAAELLQLAQQPIEDGTIDETGLQFNVSMVSGELAVEWKITATVAANGTLTMLIRSGFSPETQVVFQRYEERDNPVSGFYLGKAWEQGSLPPEENNILVYLTRDGTEVGGLSLLYLPLEPDGILVTIGEGAYDADTGDVTFSGSAEGVFVDSTGMITDGKLQAVSNAAGTDYSVEAWFMGDTHWKSPELKKPKPKKFSRGRSVTVTVAQEYLATGFVPFLKFKKLKLNKNASKQDAGLWVEKAIINDKGDLEITFNSSSNLGKAKFQVELTNLSGKSTRSKKMKAK